MDREPLQKDKTLKEAIALHRAGRLAKAESLYRSLLNKSDGDFDALHLLGVLKAQRRHYGEAEAFLRHARALNPYMVPAAINHSRVQVAMGRFDEALENADMALSLEPENAEALNIKGNALSSLGRIDGALSCFERALKGQPNHLEILNNLGNTLMAKGQTKRAIVTLKKALAIKPNYKDALNNLGIALHNIKRNQEAADVFERLLKADPDFKYALGGLLFFKMNCGDWEGVEKLSARISEGLRAGKRCVTPFELVTLADCEADQLTCARQWVADRCPLIAMKQRQVQPKDRIHVAYLSADFHGHATAFLTAGLFEQHNKDRFEVSAMSFGPGSESDMRRRLQQSFDRFLDVSGESDFEVAGLLQDLGVDIAVDLKGFTSHSRPGILAYRPAPVQVNYLGFPGTMGAEYIDYILADETIIPEESQRYFSEKVAYLPGSYQVNDAERPIVDVTPSRSEAGLPEDAFVFCCFNNGYKITPAFFDIWMRLLHKVEGSVLWLLESDETLAQNRRREAEKRGIAGERLVFAPKIELSQHLARHRLADLFLDTLPCTAHTTASDALWAGLPLLTCLGTTFAGRVSASLLEAVGLPDMVARTPMDYEALALELAHNRPALDEMKTRLSQNRATHALFNTKLFSKHIEAAFTSMWQRHLEGGAPESFSVEPSA